jgi:beta-glucosidase
VGLVHNHLAAPPIPVTETDGDSAAALAEYERTNSQLMGPVFLGHYPDAFLRDAGVDALRVEPGDLEQVARPTDFLGLNVYAGNFVRAGADGRPEVLPFPRGYPEGSLWWLKLTPQSVYWAIRHAAQAYGVQTFYMTESGATFDDVTPGGEVLDLPVDAIESIRAHTAPVQPAQVPGLQCLCQRSLRPD